MSSKLEWNDLEKETWQLINRCVVVSLEVFHFLKFFFFEGSPNFFWFFANMRWKHFVCIQLTDAVDDLDYMLPEIYGASQKNSKTLPMRSFMIEHTPRSNIMLHNHVSFQVSLCRIRMLNSSFFKKWMFCTAFLKQKKQKWRMKNFENCKQNQKDLKYL